MRLTLSKKRIISFINHNFFWIILAAYILSMFKLDFSIVLFISTFVLLCFFINLHSTTGNRMQIDIVIFYFLYLIGFSFFLMMQKGELLLYMTGLAYNVIPMLLYFIPKKESEQFWQKTFDAVFLSIIISIVLYLWPMSFYSQYLYLHGHLGEPFIQWIRPSLIQGIFGITTTSSLCACCFIYFWWQGSNKVKYSYIKAMICLGTLIYARRRAAVISAVIVFFIENIILSKKGKGSKKRIVMMVSIVFLIGIASIFFGTQAALLWQRFVDVSSAVNERSDAWLEHVLQLGNNMFLGYGLGSSGHAALANGMEGVSDGQYAYMFMEIGSVGVILFICVLIYAFKRFISNKDDEKYISMFIVILLLLQGIGSNILEFPVLGCLFWYSVSQMQGTSKLRSNFYVP